MSVDKEYAMAKARMLQNSTVIVSHKQRLDLYGLFRQSEGGDSKQSEPRNKNDIIAYQKYLAHKKLEGVPKQEARSSYIALVKQILDKTSGKPAPAPPRLPPLKINGTRKKFQNFFKRPTSLANTISKSVKAAKPMFTSGKSSRVSRTDSVEELPQLNKPTAAIEEKNVRAELFRSRAFSSVAGLSTPFGQVGEDIEKKYDLYERLRVFYSRHDPDRVKKGLGQIVEWTLTHGEATLNEQLKQKYGTNLKDMERVQSARYRQTKEDDRQRRQTQIMLSRKLVAGKDKETREKMDKLTRFLLVNDPELVSRGMYLMVKFIETKGLGALNDNLKKNYGKNLDAVTEEELNNELKKKYGKDLDMLNQPLFDNATESVLSGVEVEVLSNRGSVKNKERKVIRTKRRTKIRTKKRKNNNATVGISNMSLGTSSDVEELTQSEKHLEDYDKHKAVLKVFLKRYEPKRFERALGLMGEFMKKNGIDQLNQKLRKKYDVDLTNFRDISKEVDGRLSDSEFELKLLQFVNKNEAKKNIERAVKAMTDYKERYGIPALNTKLYMKYGTTLNDVTLDAPLASGRNDADDPALSMAAIHTVELDKDLKKKLQSYYAKYDPMILGSKGVEKIFLWAERNGSKALDKQLKAKYQESLSEFISSELRLKSELKKFYAAVDKTKLKGNHLETVLAWAMLNGRDALNFNLRKKYDKDLDTLGGNTRGNSHRGRLSSTTNDAPDV